MAADDGQPGGIERGKGRGVGEGKGREMAALGVWGVECEW